MLYTFYILLIFYSTPIIQNCFFFLSFFVICKKKKMSVFEGLYGELERPFMMTLMMVFLCIAFFVGLMVGWTWKPKWAELLSKAKLISCVSKNIDFSLIPSSPSLSTMSPLKGFGGAASCLNSFKIRTSNGDSCVNDCGVVVVDKGSQRPGHVTPTEYNDCSSSQLNEEKQEVVASEDLQHLWRLVEMKDGGPPWIHMMDRSTQTMAYQAWRRDCKTGPPQYRSRTVFEDITPDIVRDFFWDDEFRSQWDDMLTCSKTLEECPETGTMVVHWIRKFPLFCSDREYLIGRRIWASGESYYCVTKGVPCPVVPRRDKPRRVDLYYSSWCIRAVDSRDSGMRTACEVLLFHHEDMGIPQEIAKLGVRQGMWGAVKKIEPGLRNYQKARASGLPLSRPAYLAQINTKVSTEFLRSLTDELAESEVVVAYDRPSGGTIPKLIVFGGAVILACSVDQRLLPKALIVGLARGFANRARRI